jgi:hypothetical protein
MINLDMWYEDREPDFSGDDVLGPIYHNDLTGGYFANILSRNGREIGDVSSSDSVELSTWAARHGASIAWGP